MSVLESPVLILADENFYRRLEDCIEKRKDAYSFDVTFSLTSEQLRRLCALQTALGYETPGEAFRKMLRIGSYRLINERLDATEKAVRGGAETGKEESG